MQKTTRRHLLRAAAAGGAAAAAIGVAAIPRRLSASPATDENHAHGQPGLEGKKSAATMTFGAWSSNFNPPVDRFHAAPPNAANVHVIQPNEVDIEPGGTVNFIISGFHLVMVYDDGTEMVNVNPALVEPGSAPPGLINDPNNRIYRGLDPRFSPPDRVEVVHFANPGRYFVACGVAPHFRQGMNGHVNVKNPEA